jgi:hypothetical protein
MTPFTSATAQPLHAAREQHRKLLRSQLGYAGGGCSYQDVRKVFRALICNQLTHRQRRSARINVEDLGDETRERLEDLYDVLAEKCLTWMLFRAWEDKESELKEARKLELFEDLL